MLLKDLGELGLIARIQRIIKNRAQYNRTLPKDLLVGIGDDAAVWRTSAGIQIVTTDTMVEGIHFNQDTIPLRDVGWKAIASNLSDLAAMGGNPLYSLISLGLSPETTVDNIDELYEGFLDASIEYDLQIVGGNLVSSPKTFICIQITGECAEKPMLRSNAKPLDLIGIIGQLGSSRGGLELVSNSNKRTSAESAEQLINAHIHPMPLLKEGNLLINNGVLSAMDISDGLITDLRKFCEASLVSASIDDFKLPIDQALMNVFPDNYLNFALNGGEDYALMFSAPEAIMAYLKRLIPETISVIGNIYDGPVGEIIINDNLGNHTLVAENGWDHYK